MMLGILVNTDRHSGHLVGLTHAARARGHEVNIFLTDIGTRLLNDPVVRALALLQGTKMSFCAQSAGRLGIAYEGISSEIIAGSQLNNAIMNHHADKVIVL
ncbi:MAG: DsrE family protein [Nitrospirae bacterium]|nr:DsrE family protein [Nitrospirota bacterium]